MGDQFGPVEGSVHAFVATLGELTPRRKVQAETAFALARALDRMEDGSKIAALVGRLEGAMLALDSARATVGGQERSAEQPPVDADAIADLADEVAAKRRERAAGA